MSTPEIRIIRHHDELKDYAGQIVAIRSNNYYLSDSYEDAPERGSGYRFPKGHPLYKYTFAYVSKLPVEFETSEGEIESGYSLSMLFKVNAVRSACYVGQSTLDETYKVDLYFGVRSLAREECKEIRAVVEKHMGEFDTFMAPYEEITGTTNKILEIQS